MTSVFERISFHLIPSSTFTKSEVEDIKQKIIEHGGSEASLQLSSDDQSNAEPVIHDEHGFVKVPIVVTDSIDFPEYGYFEDNMISIVTPDWVDYCIDNKMLVPLRPFSPDPKYVLSQIFICVSDELTNGDKEALYGAVAALGGLFCDSLTSRTTHYVTLSMNDRRATQISAKFPGIKIILPHWIDDCLRLRRRLDEAPYMFPSPAVLDGGSASSPVNPKNDRYLSYSREPPAVSWKSIVFKNRVVCFGLDLELSDRALDAVKKLVIQAGGKTTHEVAQANVYIGQYRSGAQYLEASQNRLYVGNLTWLYWIIFHDKWISPLRKLLHYPLSRDPIPGMHGKVISVTNYYGQSRAYLQQLIIASGARYTNSLSSDNTHLIAATTRGDKFAGARKWGIHVVNHLWLEESYASWNAQPVSLPRYSHIADRLNLDGLVGQTQLIPRVLHQFYADTGKSIPTIMNSNPASPVASPSNFSSEKKPKIADETDSGNLKHLEPSSSPVKYVERVNSQEASIDFQGKTRISSVGDVPIDVAEQKTASSTDESVDESPEHASSPTTDILGTPRRKPSIINTMPIQQDTSTPRSMSATQSQSNKRTRSASPVYNKRSKLSISALLTGVADIYDKDAFHKIGIHLVSEPEKARILITPRFLRTENLLCALPTVECIVKPDYLKHCLINDRAVWPIPAKYHVRDAKLNEALRIAAQMRENKTKLFSGLQFNVSSRVRGGFYVFDHIAQCHGALPCVEIKDSRCTNFKKKDRKYILISGENDEELIEGFLSYKRTASHVVKDMEWVLNSITTMEAIL